jgi:hypothetical protein
MTNEKAHNENAIDRAGRNQPPMDPEAEAKLDAEIVRDLEADDGPTISAVAPAPPPLRRGELDDDP